MRGLVFTDDIHSAPENRKKFRSGLNSQKVKNSLLFWDKISHVSLPHMPVHPEKSFYDEMRILQEEKILKYWILMTEEEIKNSELNGFSIPSYIFQDNLSVINYEPILHKDPIEGVGLIMKDNVVEAGDGLKIGGSQMRVKEIYNNTLMMQAILTNELNKRNDEFWSIGQTGVHLEMPILEGVSIENQIFELTLSNILPLPVENTPIEKILNFKEKYQSELLKFQIAISKLNTKIEQSQGDKRVIQDCKDEIVVSLQDLHRTLDENKIKKVLGTVKTLLDVKQIGSATLIAGAVAHLAQVPIVLGALSGYIVSGLCLYLQKKKRRLKI